MIQPVIVITHAAFSPDRCTSLRLLITQMRIHAHDIDVLIARDDDRRGSLWCWYEAMRMGLETGATHIVWLPDDAIICPHYGRILRACIAARPDDVWDAYVNHPEAVGLSTLWYSTPDGYTGVGGVMPRNALIAHLEWRERQGKCLDGWPNDAGVNTWAMATGRRIYKTSVSLVTHDDSIPSLDGNAVQNRESKGANPLGDVGDIMQFLGKTWLAPQEHRPGWASSCTHLGRTYERTHWKLLELPDPPIARFWDACRGKPATYDKPALFIATPAYMGQVTAQFTVALLGEMRALQEAGIPAGWTHIDDSAIDRCRNRLVTAFMLSDASHMLFWDPDNVPTKPGWSVELIKSGHDVVGGAVVQKTEHAKRTFAMQIVTAQDRAVEVKSGCVRAWSLGTGFMLVTRSAIERLMSVHMSEWYVNHTGIEWNLFSGKAHGRLHYAEDYEFCRKWRDLGESPWILPDIDFVHVGLKAYTGSFRESVLSSE